MRIMRFRLALIFLLTLVLLAAIPVANGAADLTTQGFLYSIVVDEDGNAQVEISFRDSAGAGSKGAWLAVPSRRFTNWSWSGDVSFNRTSIDFFYDNLSFSYSRDVAVAVRYNFSRASMIVEPDAFFMSPRILFGPLQQGEGRVSLSRVGRDIASRDVSPYPDETSTDGDRVEMVFSLDRSVERITVYYVVTGQIQLQSIAVGKYTGVTPRRYAEVMDSILQLYSRNEEKLEDLFHTQISNVTVRFFSPKPDQMDIEGYTPFNATHMGDIFMNLFYTRFIPGHFEQAALHELVHHYLWASGIAPQILWIHEGGANFFSTQLTLEEGYVGAEIFRDNITSIGESLGGQYGFIEDWAPGSAIRDLSRRYAAAYMVFEELNRTYGFEIFSRFFGLLSENVGRSVDGREAIRFFSLAAGENLNLVFRSMGFRDLPDLSDVNFTRTATWSGGTQDVTFSAERNPLVAFVAGLLLVVIAATVIVLAVISTRRARGDYQVSSDTYYEF